MNLFHVEFLPHEPSHKEYIEFIYNFIFVSLYSTMKILYRDMFIFPQSTESLYSKHTKLLSQYPKLQLDFLQNEKSLQLHFCFITLYYVYTMYEYPFFQKISQ